MAKIDKEALALHRENHGKWEIAVKVPVATEEELSKAYTPGVAAPCLEIKENPDALYEYTSKGNTVAVVTNGTAVLGLGDIGAGAGLPVMEGKAVLFKAFAGVDAVPICLDTKDPEEIIRTVKLLAPSFGGINVEDIKAPECFDIENALREQLDIPVMHDDQHGTAIVVAAALINAFKIVGKTFHEAKVVINGAGAAGQAIARLLQAMNTQHIILCDRTGAIYAGREKGMNPYKDAIAEVTNRKKEQGSLADVAKGADVLIGVSTKGAFTAEMIQSMAKDAIIFAMANPEPEIFPEAAKKAGARVVGTGRSDFPNQINNLLAFPGIFRGALDVRASDINEAMKIAAAKAIASEVPEEYRDEDHVIPSPFAFCVAPVVAAAVAQAAIDTGVARNKEMTANDVGRHTEELTATVQEIGRCGPWGCRPSGF